MAIAIRQQTTVAAGTAANSIAAPSFSVPTIPGNGIICLITYNANNFSSVTDDGGGSNTWANARVANNAGANLSLIQHCLNPTQAVTTVTGNFSASTGVVSIQAIEVFGALTANAGNTRIANAQAQTVTAFTTTVADTIVFVTARSNNTPTLPTGFTDLGSAANYHHSYAVFTSTQTSLTPSWSVGVSTPFAACGEAYTSTVTVQAAYVPIGPHGILLPVDMPVDLPQYIRNGFVLPGTTANTSTWSPRATVVVPELPRPSPPPPRPVNAWLLPQTNNSPSDFHPRPRPVEPVPLPVVVVTPRTSAILFPGFVSPPDLFHRIHSLDLLERSPVGADPRRVARITDKLSQRINSLVRRGEMFRIDNDEWTLRGGARSVARNPASFDDTASGVVIGQLWVNSVTKKLWVCVDATKGAAVWIGPLG